MVAKRVTVHTVRVTSPSWGFPKMGAPIMDPQIVGSPLQQEPNKAPPNFGTPQVTLKCNHPKPSTLQGNLIVGVCQAIQVIPVPSIPQDTKKESPKCTKYVPSNAGALTVCQKLPTGFQVFHQVLQAFEQWLKCPLNMCRM